MMLKMIPWEQRVWGLAVMTVLSPSARYYQQRQRRPKTLLERSLQMLKALHRWLPDKAAADDIDIVFCGECLTFIRYARR